VKSIDAASLTIERLAALQEVLYAQSRHALLVIFEGMALRRP